MGHARMPVVESVGVSVGVSAEALEKASEERAGLIASRAGEVLGAHTILKEDHFPGCQSAKLPNIVPGAPNFRGVPGQNVYGSALPTVDGIKEVLEHVGAASKSRDKQQVCPLTAYRCSKGGGVSKARGGRGVSTWEAGAALQWQCSHLVQQFLCSALTALLLNDLWCPTSSTLLALSTW